MQFQNGSLRSPSGSAFSVEKIFEKIRENFQNFFSIFSKFFSIEFIPRECRLRTQNFMTVGQTVSAVGELTDIRTDTQTNFVSNIDVGIRFLKLKRWKDEIIFISAFYILGIQNTHTV